jgi:hypothetical protein
MDNSFLSEQLAVISYRVVDCTAMYIAMEIDGRLEEGG